MPRRYYCSLPDADRARVISRFSDSLSTIAEQLAAAASALTGVPIRYHREDVDYTRRLFQLMLQARPAPEGCRFRARGRVLLGLSANEPLVMGLIPECAALLTGNEVLLRPATPTRPMVERFVAMLRECGLPEDALTLLPPGKESIASAMATVDHVVWIGSSGTCREIATQAARLPVTWTTEAEGYDLAVFDETLGDDRLHQAARQVVESVAKHNGQTCQAIRAVLVHVSRAGEARAALRAAIASLRIGPAEDPTTDATEPPELIEASTLQFPEQAPFRPVSQLVVYRDESELHDCLARSPFGLSVAFFTQRDADAILDGPARHARVGRVLVNAPPAQVALGLPWGGYRRSGSAGPHDLLLEFADLAVIYQGGP